MGFKRFHGLGKQPLPFYAFSIALSGIGQLLILNWLDIKIIKGSLQYFFRYLTVEPENRELKHYIHNFR